MTVTFDFSPTHDFFDHKGFGLQANGPRTGNWPTWPTFRLKNSARESGV